MASLQIALESVREQLLALKPAGPDGFEGLVASALADLSGYTFRLAKSGSQFGRDASTSPAPFAIAMEGKRYASSPSLEDIAAKAVVAGNALGDTLDVWVLGCTSEVGDEIVHRATGILDEHGVTLLVLDWARQPLPALAVLLSISKETCLDWFEHCAPAVDQKALAHHLDTIAGHHACDEVADGIRRALDGSSVGLDALRQRSNEWFTDRLVDPSEAQISFGQFLSPFNESIVAQPRASYRNALQVSIDTPSPESVVAIVGDEGVGKTWLIREWWSSAPNPPIIIFVSGRRVSGLRAADAVESLATLLAEQDGRVDDPALRAWRRKVTRWQTFESGTQQRLVLVLDGLNEHANQPWADIIRSHQKIVTALGGRLVVTSRTSFWKREVLPRLGDSFPLTTIEVSGYSDEELVAVLEPTHVDPLDLAEPLRDFIRNPRVCSVAVRLLHRLELQPNELTVERLLLEYWQARLVERGNLIAHNARDFSKLLQSHARDWRAQPHRFFDRDNWLAYSGAAKRRGFEEVQNDLTEIEEGRFLRISANNPNVYEFREEALPFALGLLINEELRAVLTSPAPTHQQDADERLATLLEPVRGFDAISEIVAAAVGLACLDVGFPDLGREALIRAYCTLQNVSSNAFEALAAYVPTCPDAFLNVAESPHGIFELVAHPEFITEALIQSRDRPPVYKALRRRLPLWLSRWSKRTQQVFAKGDPKQDERASEREKRIAESLGLLLPAEFKLFEKLTLEVEGLSSNQLDQFAALLMVGRPLLPYTSGLLGWALVQAVASDLYEASDGLSWVVRLNRIDPEQTEASLKELIAGVSLESSKPMRSAAATILRLLGDSESDRRADALRPIKAGERWRRVELFCETNPHDPDAAPCSNLDSARVAVAQIDPTKVWIGMGQTIDEINLETVTPALARFDEKPLLDVLRQVTATAPMRTGVALRQLAWNLPELSPLFGESELAAIQNARKALLTDPSRVNPDDLFLVHSQLTSALIPLIAASDQLDLLLELPADTPLFTHMARGLKPITPLEFEKRITEAEAQQGDHVLKRILFFGAGSRTPLTDNSRRSIIAALESPNEQVSILASILVYQARDDKLDTALLDAAEKRPQAIDSSYAAWSHGRAVAAALLKAPRPNALHLLQPEFFSVLAERLGDEALEIVADLTERALFRLLTAINGRLDKTVEFFVDASSDGFEKKRWAEDMSRRDEDVFSMLSDLAEPEKAAKEFVDRQARMHAVMIAYEKQLVEQGASAIAEPPQVEGLRAVVHHDPHRVRQWVERIISTDDPRLLTQVRNLGLAICGAYASYDGVLATRALEKLRDISSILRVTIDGIGLFERALFAAGDVDELTNLREAVFLGAFDDESNDSATFVTETCGAAGWLTSFVERLVSSPNIGEKARGITIAGFRRCNESSDRILGDDWGTGFLAQVAVFARKNYRRDAWARHWLERAAKSTDPVDFWRFSRLAEGLVDKRFARWAGDLTSDNRWEAFSEEVLERLKRASEKRTKERAKSLFGLKVPERDLLQLLRDQ